MDKRVADIEVGRIRQGILGSSAEDPEYIGYRNVILVAILGI